MLLNIITVTKDDLDGLKKTLQSTALLRQKDDVLQIVVDSSRGETRKSVESLLKDKMNVNYLWQEPSGISAAFNLGLENVSGEWVWFLNGGDEIHEDLEPEFFFNLLLKNSADAIIFQVKNMQSKKIYRHPELWAVWPPVLSWIPHPSTITRRSLYEKYGYFDKSYKIAMDYEFWIRCFARDVVVDLVSIPVSRFDQSGVSSVDGKLIKSEVRKIIRRYFWLLIKKWLGNGLIIAKSIKVSSRFSK
jgi:glycosyltransferase involved in cell wall biosynthesis